MTIYQHYNIELVKKLREENPNSYSKIIARDSKFVEWLGSQIGFDTEHVPEMVYALLNPSESAFCGNNQRRKFRNINIGWLGCGDRQCPSCSVKRKEKAKNTNLEKYGVENPAQHPDVKQKIKDTNLARYGVEYALVAESVKDKRKQTCLEKFGVDHNWKTESGQQKRKSTILTRWGVTNPSQSQELQEKKKKTFRERHGVDYSWQSSDIKKKSELTMMERWAVTNPSYSTSLRDRAKKTTIERFGVEYASQNPAVKEKIKKTVLERYGVEHAMRDPALRQRAVDAKRKSFYDNLSERVNGVVVPLFEFDQYQSVDVNYLWRCNQCSKEFEDHLDDGHIPQCPTCYPRVKSQGEEDLYAFVKSLYNGEIIRNTRSVIAPLELDIFIPDKKLAIEYHGIYRHSEISGSKDRNYHLRKTLNCQLHDVRLIQIFDVEWLEKNHIVKSRLANVLGQSAKIPGRKCQITVLTSKEKSNFLELNHTQGDCNSSINLGLHFGNQLVAVMTFGKTRYNKSAKYELLRYASIVNHRVLGGASKLLSYFEKLYNYPSIVSYSDRRWNSGNLYENLGFSYCHSSSPNYWYWKSNGKLESRIKYQKHKLKNFHRYDQNLSEWEIMKNAGYDRIWDCGNHVYLKTNN
jgi:DNA-directed RNA polymerase subunit RPC12/RpoP